jgi:hypothetical protein
VFASPLPALKTKKVVYGGSEAMNRAMVDFAYASIISIYTLSVGYLSLKDPDIWL